MKHLVYTFACCLLLLAACGEHDDATPIEDNDAMSTVQAAGMSKFPTVTKDAYAPWAKMEGEAFSTVHPADAPKATDVDIPPFPDSFIVSSGVMGQGAAALHFVTLVCADAPEAVQDYYTRELVTGRDWTYASQYNVFQPGSGNDFLVNNTPFVSVTALNSEAEEMRFVDKEFIRNFHTRIQISYR